MESLIPIMAGSLLCAVVFSPITALIVSSVNFLGGHIGIPISKQSFLGTFLRLWLTVWCHFTISFWLWFVIGPMLQLQGSEALISQFCILCVPALLIGCIVRPRIAQFVLIYIMLVPMGLFIFMYIAFVTFPPVGDPFYIDWQRLLYYRVLSMRARSAIEG